MPSREGAVLTDGHLGGEMIASMGLAPITASHLLGRVHKRGKALTVTDPNGDVVVEAALGKAARPAYAIFGTAGGQWGVAEGRGSGLTGAQTASVVDSKENVVARLLEGEVVLPDGERLTWGLSGLPPHCRIGGDLWVARLGMMRERRFKAELSRVMLARDDLDLLTGLASVLTYSAQELRRSRTSAAGSVGV